MQDVGIVQVLCIIVICLHYNTRLLGGLLLPGRPGELSQVRRQRESFFQHEYEAQERIFRHSITRKYDLCKRF